MVTRIQIAKPDIVKYFDSQAKKIMDGSDINGICDKNRSFWRLAQNMSTKQFVDFLSKHTKLKMIRFDFPYRAITKYTWGDVPFYELILSLKPNCYFTHYTALYFHELTDQIPKVIYLNVEQEKKLRTQTILNQKNIDIAFKRPTRLSTNVVRYQDFEIRLLNGMYTGNLGVIEKSSIDGAIIRLTDIERTLIDITVRPEYAGGVFEVLRAYKQALNKVSVNRLAAILKQINYIYPYHQAVGFYLEKAGYSRSQIDLLGKFPIKNDFYLAHQINAPEFSQRWRLYHPKGIN
jgi:hypothetical protein